ncbi:hypothetical protein HPB49_024686 [Dermacentor silvarum]|uniref:Uncharacterized protein n=1 Tax=Dermacentor silvarum TaxID=543639 RepID=A0ACB8CIG4_DERSI|nr:hypothetical protein HPB49_024686 [Dermacentor silvarum]
MALTILGQALFFAIATAMGLWMQGYVKLQIAVHGPSVLVPANRTEPAEFYSEKFGEHAYVTANVHPGHKREVVLVGHDWGGMISMCFATLHEKMIDKMVLINSMHPKAFMKQLFRSPTQMRMSWYQLPFRRPVVPEQYLILKDFAFFDDVHKGFTKEEEYAHKYMYSRPGHFAQRECPTHVTERIREFASTGSVNVAKDTRWSWWKPAKPMCSESKEAGAGWTPQSLPFIPDGAELPKSMTL